MSLLALLVMNLDRYLAICHPLYHKANITKHKLLSIFGITLFLYTILHTFYIDEMVYSVTVQGIIFLCLYMPPMLFVNYKLFKISRKHHSFNSIIHDKKRTVSLKQVSTCLMAFANLMLVSIASLIFLVYNILFPNTRETDAVVLWLKTILTLNSTFNCLIFFWKKQSLRTEAINIAKATTNSFCPFKKPAT